ncbi:hypothetical protein OROGR_029170 [Orobanche gracilis]
MNFDNDDFFVKLSDALQNLQEPHDQRWQPRWGDFEHTPRLIESKNLDWEWKIDRMFDLKDLNDEKRE